jgi:hypothetical protein
VLISLEVWSDWLDLRYAVVDATPEPEGELPRQEVIGGCAVSDWAGTEYVNWTSSVPSFGMVRIHQDLDAIRPVVDAIQGPRGRSLGPRPGAAGCPVRVRQEGDQPWPLPSPCQAAQQRSAATPTSGLLWHQGPLSIRRLFQTPCSWRLLRRTCCPVLWRPPVGSAL